MSKPPDPRDVPIRREEVPTAHVEVRNPRYAGATPEDVARARLRPDKKRPAGRIADDRT
jgi:hypothetical protein